MSRRNLLLAVLVVILGALYLLVTRGSSREEGTASVEPFGFVGEGTVREISVSGPEGAFRLRRDEHRWQLTEPFSAPAEEAVVEQLLTLADTVVLEPLEITAAELEPYGLLPQARLEVSIAGGEGQGGTIYLGRELPLDVIHSYTLLPGRETLYRTLTDFRKLFPRSIDSLVDSRLLPLEPQEVTALLLENGASATRIERRGAQFVFDGEGRLPADTPRVLSLARQLFESRISRSQRGTLSAGEREASVRLTFEAAGGERVSLTVPPPGQNGQRFAGSLWPEHLLVLAGPPALPPLNADYFRDRRLLPLEPAELSRLSLRGPRGELSLRREGEGWRLFTGDPATGRPARDAAVIAALRSLGELRGERFATEAPGAPTPPSGEPLLLLEALTDDGRLQRLAVHAGPDGGYLAYSSRYEEPLLISPEVYRRLSVDPAAFEDRRLLAFALSQVGGVRVRAGEREFRIRREEAGDWYLQGARRRLLDTPRVVGFLFDLESLEHLGTLAELGETDRIEIRLEAREGETLSWLVIGDGAAESSRFEAAYTVSREARATLQAFVDYLSGL